MTVANTLAYRAENSKVHKTYFVVLDKVFSIQAGNLGGKIFSEN
jgi:hypothetical protein